MLTFYTYGPGAASTQGNDEDALRAAFAAEPPFIWVDLHTGDEEMLKRVGALFKLDKESIEDAIAGEQRPRIDEYDDYLFFLLYGLLGAEPESQTEYHMRKIALFLGERYLITVHAESLKTIAGLHKRCARNPSPVLKRGPEFLLFTIIDTTVDNYMLVAETLEKQIEDLEDESLDVRNGPVFLESVSEARRQLIDLRHMITAEREMIMPLARGEFEQLSEETAEHFVHVADHLLKTYEEIDGLRELLFGVRDNYHSQLANQTNEIMKVLTIFASILLPITFVAGLYGMNVALWPGPDNPYAFPVILFAMVAITAAMLAFFRWRKWL